MNETLTVKIGHRWGLLASLLLLLLSPQVIAEEEGPHPSAGTGNDVRLVQKFSVTINTKRPVNVLDSEFIGFYAKPQDIFDGLDNPITESSFLMAKALGQTYLKVVADSSQLYLQTTRGQSVIGGPETDGLVHITTSAWKAFYEWAQRAGLSPIFVLDYPVNGTGASGWKPKNALRILSAASSLGINECKWQLGNGDITDGARYVEDLRTFRTMVQAFAKQNQQWDVVASELNVRSMPLEDAQYFNAQLETLVDAVTIASCTLNSDDGAAWNATSLLRDIRVRGLSGQRRAPIWLDLIDEESDNKRKTGNSDLGSPSCSNTCLREGLAYARTLGEAARGGANVVFKPLHRDDIRKPTLSYLIALLHKRTIGRKVFSVQTSKQAAADQTYLYAYCGRSRNATGALTVFIVNEDALEASNVTLRLSQTRAGSTPVELYLINVQHGQPMINNRTPQEDSDGTPVRLHPVYATTSFRNGSSFYVPPESILYAVLPGVQVRECHHDIPSARYKKEQQSRRYREASLEDHHDRTSADVLLQDLIGDIVENVPLEALQRRKRWAVGEVETPKVHKKRFPLRFPGTSQSVAITNGHGPQGAKAEDSAAAEKVATDQLDETPGRKGQRRSARQTQAYKRQQRRLRLKEKRSEKRNLRKMKYPLRESMRERPKRGGHLQMHHQRRLVKRMPMTRVASPKTKRSSLAEAVNEPPMFGEGSDESAGTAATGHRSGFPLGDVHLVISKAPNGEDGVDYVTEEENEEEQQQQHDEAEDLEEKIAVERLGMFGLRSTPSRPLRHRAVGPRRRISVSQRDFRRYTNPEEDNAEEDECEHRCRQHQRQRDNRGMSGAESRRIDRYMSIVKDSSRVRDEEADRATEASTLNNGEIHASIAPKKPNRSNDSEGEAEKESESIEDEQKLQQQQQQQGVGRGHGTVSSNHLEPETEELVGEESREPVAIRAQAPPVTSEPPILLYTPAPQTSEERQDLLRLQDSWSLESEGSASAEVTEVRPRFKRSNVDDSGPIDEAEVEQDIERLEDFFRTNAKLQQKFAEMFDLLLEAIEELGPDENDASERIDKPTDQEDAEPAERVKRNVLLHIPQSWESRERSNMIQRKEVPSIESRENYVEPELLPLVPRASTTQSGNEQDHHAATAEAHEGEDVGDGSRPGAYVIRTVVSFMRKASSEFHQLFSNWFGKTS
ncbi:hypothetical protein AND_009842 [Anopheles darlingi]|uniref:Heparanase n=1 Tax=Anopheles darlingi TaxID=43151 RepID=W5J3Z0_ANODA|nr:hypothetical protein AND_009842 [Anopheles darlingi]